MSDTLYARILKEAVELGVQTLNLSVYGEPLMDPNFVSRVRLAGDVGLNVVFFTNGGLMTEQKARDLLACPNLRHVYFSLNRFSSATYNRVMVNLKRETTYANVERFLSLKQMFGRHDLSVTLSYILFDWTKPEQKAFRDYWHGQPGVDHLYFPGLRNRGGATLDLEEIGPVILSPTVQKKTRLHPCKFLWDDLFVYYDGLVGPCCEDIAHRKLIVGDLARDSLRDIWDGERLAALRSQHLDGRRAQHAVCGRRCTYNPPWINLYL